MWKTGSKALTGESKPLGQTLTATMSDGPIWYDSMKVALALAQHTPRTRYTPPTRIERLSLTEMLRASGRKVLEPRQAKLLANDGDVQIFAAGNLQLLMRPGVSIVGTRDVSEAGRVRAKRLARELVEAGVVVTSGLAKGIDTAAHTSAIESGGNTISVIGTPLSKAYPAENAALQEWIYNEHLLISPFRDGEPVFRGNFPKRNRVMAALSDATVIVEASDTSGTLHQAAECQRLGRWLFIMKSVAEDPALKWPTSFIGKDRVAVLASTKDILDVIINNQSS